MLTPSALEQLLSGATITGTLCGAAWFLRRCRDELYCLNMDGLSKNERTLCGKITHGAARVTDACMIVYLGYGIGSVASSYLDRTLSPEEASWKAMALISAGTFYALTGRPETAVAAHTPDAKNDQKNS